MTMTSDAATRPTRGETLDLTPGRGTLVGVLLPHFGAESTWERLVGFAPRLEQLGYRSVWVRDQINYHPHGFESRSSRFVDPFMTLSAVGMLTRRVILGTATVVTFRHPLVVSQLFVLRLMRGHTRTGAAALGGLVLAITWGLILAAAFLPSRLERAAVMVLALGIMGLGAALLSPTLVAIVNDIAPNNLRGRYNAVYHISAQVAPLLAPAVAGWTLGHGLGVPLMAALSGASLAAAGSTLWFGRIVPRSANLVPAPEPQRQRPAKPPTDSTPTVSFAGGE